MSDDNPAPQDHPATSHPATANPPEATPEAVAAGEARKKKRRTSRGLRDLQRINRRLTRTAHRLSRAVEKGISTYRERSEASAENKRDGALRDLPRNAAEGLSVTLRKASRLPVELVDAVDVPTTRRLVRFGTRVLLMPLSR